MVAVAEWESFAATDEDSLRLLAVVCGADRGAGCVLRSLGVNGPDIPPTEAERAARYRTSLADRWMLVLLDNARDTDQVRQLLPAGAG
jgi:hypothetical protein